MQPIDNNLSPKDAADQVVADLDEAQARMVAHRITTIINSAPVRSEVALYGWALSLCNGVQQLDMSREELADLIDRSWETVAKAVAAGQTPPPIPQVEEEPRPSRAERRRRMRAMVKAGLASQGGDR